MPFVAWLMAGYFKTIPGELEECARIDGASRLGAIWRIAFPLATPGILSAGIFAFTLSWNEFIYALTLVTACSERTIPVGVLVQLTRADFYFWGPLMAGALAGLDPGRADLLVLRGPVRRRSDRGGGEGLIRSGIRRSARPDPRAATRSPA